MLILNPSTKQLSKARSFMDEYVQGGYGKNVLGVSDAEFYHFIRIGKLCEIVFTDYLNTKQIAIDNSGMLEACADEFKHGADFILTKTNQEVDIKSGNKPFHFRLLVREDQFKAHIHDVYIGAKWVSDEKIEVHGYVTGDDLKHIIPANFGTGLCRYIKLNEMKPIDRFVDLAKNGDKII
jgi:hypothetical protein